MKKNKAEKKSKPRKNALRKRISPEIEAAKNIAKYYNFHELPPLEVAKEDVILTKKFHESHIKSTHPFRDKCDRFGGFLEEKISILRNFAEKKFTSLPQPIMGFYEAPLKGNPHMKKNVDEETFNMEIIGSSKSIAEATLIETALIILRERYPDQELCLEINSIGDKDSLGRFCRELGNFCKKELKNFGKLCRTNIKEDIFSAWNCTHKNCQAILEEAPRSMSYLSESSRNHFKEVLEYLESLHIPYNINPTLLGSRSYCTETIFEIIGKKDGVESMLAIGERYNGLTKKIWGKKDVPAVGIALLMHPHFIKSRVVKEKTKATKFFFIQFGFDAKLKSLTLIEMLRLANIPVEQSLSKDKLTVQLASAEKMNVPYVLIMGQKEAMEESIVVRDLNTRSQETVFIKDLVKYLKKLK